MTLAFDRLEQEDEALAKKMLPRNCCYARDHAPPKGVKPQEFCRLRGETNLFAGDDHIIVVDS